MTPQGIEQALLSLPPGYRVFMVFAAATKRWLLTKTDAETRLAYLEFLNGLTDNQVLTPPMVAAIRPMGDVEHQMFCAAMELDSGQGGRCPNACDLIQDWDTFEQFARVNPSYAAAMRIAERERQEQTGIAA